MNNKIGWKCIITGCTSPAKALGHYFPKNKNLMKKWLDTISMPWISNLSESEIRKCRICHLHFSEDAYIFTLNRRRLKHNAIPTQNLLTHAIENDIFQSSIKQVQEVSITLETSTQCNDIIERIESDITQSDMRQVQEESTLETNTQCNDIERIESDIVQSDVRQIQEENTLKTSIQCSKIIERMESDISQPSTSKIHEEDILEINSQQKVQELDSEIINTSKRSNLTNYRRSIPETITRKNHLPPVARKLYDKCKIFQKQNTTLRKNLVQYKQRLKYATKFSNLTFFKKYSELTNTQKMFIDLQIKNVNKKSKGVRFSLHEKVMALSLYKESCNGYKLLQLFTLPSSRTLRHLLQKVPIHAGINDVIFSHLSHQQSIMSDVHDKLCILMWDEMSLQPNLQYDALNDKIIGFEDWGHRRTQGIADDSLVFMLRGIKTGWKIPISYNFCKSATKSTQLIRCIKIITDKIIKAGFIIVATVCDQGSPNVAAINQLIRDTRGNCLKTGEQFDERIILHGQKVITLYDGPHLKKGMRNNFLDKDIKIDISEKEPNVKALASWDVIETAYKLDIHSNLLNRQLKKLTDQHVIENKI